MHRDTVFIVDDDASVRDALSLLLSLRGYTTATFASAEDFLSAVQPSWRGCIVLDLRMPGMSGLELQRCLLEGGPTLPVIVVTAHGDVAAARQAFLADAVDFIEKPFDGEQLMSAIETALAGLRAVSSAVEPAASARMPAAVLSAREREVMALMVKGLHNRRIAEELGISPRTVEVHKARVMDKLGVRNVVELVRLVDQGRK
ncbi:MAG: response regulator transcription factor [Rubrivivax sp.]|nr:response regulator transcription factor [Rubrivivax sp.]